MPNLDEASLLALLRSDGVEEAFAKGVVAALSQ
jgi:hypothetical protein